jgi:hypothetical protein
MRDAVDLAAVGRTAVRYRNGHIGSVTTIDDGGGHFVRDGGRVYVRVANLVGDPTDDRTARWRDVGPASIVERCSTVGWVEICRSDA